MSVHRIDQAVILGLPISLDRFPILIEEHRRRYPDTFQLEQAGDALIENGLTAEGVIGFVRDVCGWGGYAGIGGRVLKNNPPQTITDSFQEALAHLEERPRRFGLALACINRLHGLGSPSFASKHLRFLRPDVCPVYDSILRDALPYAYDSDGYDAFAQDCVTIADHLREAQVPNAVDRVGGEWYAADVEAAIYAHVNQWLA